MPEAAVVQRGEEDGLAARVDVEGLGHQDRAGLGQGLDDEDAGHDRILREVPLEEALVDADRLDPHKGLAGDVLFRPVDQEEGIAVRNARQDLVDIDGVAGGLVRHDSAPFLRRPEDRESQATSRNHFWTGWAGKPPQVSPAGTSRRTPPDAPMRAPSPMFT